MKFISVAVARIRVADPGGDDPDPGGDDKDPDPGGDDQDPDPGGEDWIQIWEEITGFGSNP